jgi:NRPS condensation-like uncharacterized protein
MGGLGLTKTSALLRRANSAGIRLSVVQGELIANFEGALSMESNLLQEMRLHKDDLIKYLSGYAEQPEKMDAPHFDLIRIKYEDQYYYAISPIQLYWVDPEMDKEYKENNPIHGARSVLLELTGEFDTGAFKEAVHYLVVRHESLRTTFHKIRGDFLLKVEEAVGNCFEDIGSERIEDVWEMLRFSDHTFDLSGGPLFIVRLFRKEKNVHHIAIKFHHVIFDSLSEDILLEEMLAAYLSFCKGCEPGLPMLKYQYKDYLSAMVRFTNAYADEHRAYWRGMYKCLPSIIRLPEARGTGRKMENKIAGVERFSLRSELIEKLTFFCNLASASLFVVIQAIFKFFLFRKTGAADILIGTDVFGRNYPGMESQIGCYATTAYLRTVFTAEDSFETAIGKVKKANEDMYDYRGSALNEVMELMLPPGEILAGSYWKFSLLFRDLHMSTGKSSGGNALPAELNIKMATQHETVDRVIAVDMIWKFLKFEEKIELELLYDMGLYSGDGINMVVSDFFEFLARI